MIDLAMGYVGINTVPSALEYQVPNQVELA